MSNHVLATHVPTGPLARRNGRILERLKKCLIIRARFISSPNGRKNFEDAALKNEKPEVLRLRV